MHLVRFDEKKAYPSTSAKLINAIRALTNALSDSLRAYDARLSHGFKTVDDSERCSQKELRSAGPPPEVPTDPSFPIIERVQPGSVFVG